VALIDADLPWAELAAIPETFATAWTCLFRGLGIKRGQLLDGVRVIATTRSEDRFDILQKLGVVTTSNFSSCDMLNSFGLTGSRTQSRTTTIFPCAS
jgi:hypothetical protein